MPILTVLRPTRHTPIHKICPKVPQSTQGHSIYPFYADRTVSTFIYVVIPLTHHKNSGYIGLNALGVYLGFMGFVTGSCLNYKADRYNSSSSLCFISSSSSQSGLLSSEYIFSIGYHQTGPLPLFP